MATNWSVDVTGLHNQNTQHFVQSAKRQAVKGGKRQATSNKRQAPSGKRQAASHERQAP